MTANTKDYLFTDRQPYNKNVKLWRYMDFPKFVSLISSSSLFLARSELFEDVLEGVYPYQNVKEMRLIEEKIGCDLYERLYKTDYFLDKPTFINCWHMSNYESAAMWKLYSESINSIAIETTYLTLEKNLPNEVFLGCVNYIDYNSITIPYDKSLIKFMYKRKSFEHEKEVRIITQSEKEENKNGIQIKIDLNNLIKKIHISPTAQSWFYNLVEEICKKYEIEVEIQKSNLYEKPTIK